MPVSVRMLNAVVRWTCVGVSQEADQHVRESTHLVPLPHDSAHAVLGLKAQVIGLSGQRHASDRIAVEALGCSKEVLRRLDEGSIVVRHGDVPGSWSGLSCVLFVTSL